MTDRPVSRTRDIYEQRAQEWDEAGRPEPANPDPWDTMVIYTWTGSRGARKAGVSPVLKAYVAALRGVLDRQDAGWYNTLLNRPDYCDNCGEYYRLENVSVCTHCGATFAPCHPPNDYWPNGNAQCRKCRKGEVVG